VRHIFLQQNANDGKNEKLNPKRFVFQIPDAEDSENGTGNEFGKQARKTGLGYGSVNEFGGFRKMDSGNELGQRVRLTDDPKTDWGKRFPNTLPKTDEKNGFA